MTPSVLLFPYSNHYWNNLLNANLKINYYKFQTTEALRKSKANSTLCARVTSRMLELRKSCTTTTPLTPETAATAMHTALEAVIEQLKPDIPNLKLEHPAKDLKNLLAPHIQFLCMKAMRYFSLGSYPFQYDFLIYILGPSWRTRRLWVRFPCEGINYLDLLALIRRIRLFFLPKRCGVEFRHLMLCLKNGCRG